MATFVLVHGGWDGGYVWTPVAKGLRAAGHEAYTPTLTGADLPREALCPLSLRRSAR